MTETALYRLFDAGGRLLYVGITSETARRWKQHEAGKKWWPDVAEKTVTWHDTRIDAEIAELQAIRDEAPQYNWQTVNGADQTHLGKIRSLSNQIADLEEQQRRLTAELNDQIFYAFPENRGETGKPPHGLIADLMKSSGKSRQHITDVRAGKYRQKKESGAS